MAGIPIEQPEVADVKLVGYLVRQTVAINAAFAQQGHYSPRTILPNKVRVGDTFYFGAAIPTTDITGEGLWIYKSTGWTLVA